MQALSPKEECEVLLSALIPFAESQLKKHSGFFPFGAVMLNDGTTELTSCYNGSDSPDPKEILEQLKSIHRNLASKNSIKASGIVWNASVFLNGNQADAIIISLEHKDDYSVVVGEPYRIGLLKKLSTDALFANEGNHDIFG